MGSTLTEVAWLRRAVWRSFARQFVVSPHQQSAAGSTRSGRD
jgi:hypothetical protein